MAGEIEPCSERGVEQGGVDVRRPAERDAPREGLGPDGHGIVEEDVTAEHLVGRLARQRDGGVLAHAAKEQVPGGVEIPGRHRPVVGAQDGVPVGPGRELARLQHDVGVVGPDVRGQLVGEGGVRRDALPVGLEALGVADVVDREGADRAIPPRGALGERRDRGGVQAAGEEGAERDVGEELVGDDVLEELADRRHGGLAVVLVRGGLEAPVPADVRPPWIHVDHPAGLDLPEPPVDAVAGVLNQNESTSRRPSRPTTGVMSG